MLDYKCLCGFRSVGHPRLHKHLAQCTSIDDVTVNLFEQQCIAIQSLLPEDPEGPKGIAKANFLIYLLRQGLVELQEYVTRV